MDKRKEAMVSGSSFKSSASEGFRSEMSEDIFKEKNSRHGRDGRASEVENAPGGIVKRRFCNVPDMGAVVIV